MTLELGPRGDREELRPERVAEALGAQIVSSSPAECSLLAILLGHVPLPARPSHVEDSETPEGPKPDNNPS